MDFNAEITRLHVELREAVELLTLVDRPQGLGYYFDDDLRDKVRAFIERNKISEPPYPWCTGNPTKEDCIKAGYCKKDPNCGE